MGADSSTLSAVGFAANASPVISMEFNSPVLNLLNSIIKLILIKEKSHAVLLQFGCHL